MLGSSLLDKGDITDAEVMLRESLNITKISSPENRRTIAIGEYLNSCCCILLEIASSPRFAWL